MADESDHGSRSLDLIVDYNAIDDEPRVEKLIFTLKGRGVDRSMIADVLLGKAR